MYIYYFGIRNFCCSCISMSILFRIMWVSHVTKQSDYSVGHLTLDSIALESYRFNSCRSRWDHAIFPGMPLICIHISLHNYRLWLTVKV